MKTRVLALLLLFFPLALQAKKSPAKAAKTKDDKVIYKAPETHKFQGLRLKGELKKPEISYIYQRKGIRGEQIIHIPEDFNDKVIEGASNL
jgi:hypothetical protein